MVKFNIALLVSGAFSTCAAAAPVRETSPVDRAPKGFPSGSVTILVVAPNTPYAKTFSGKNIEAALEAFEGKTGRDTYLFGGGL